MDFESLYIDQLIEIRKEARENKNWQLSDSIRDYLDAKMIFIFDTKLGQEILYLPVEYFKDKDKRIETIAMSQRQYVEYRIKEEIRIEKIFDSWLYSMKGGR